MRLIPTGPGPGQERPNRLNRLSQKKGKALTGDFMSRSIVPAICHKAIELYSGLQQADQVGRWTDRLTTVDAQIKSLGGGN